MQAKHHMIKLIKFSSKFPYWKTLKGSETRSQHYRSWQKFWDISGQTNVGNEEIDLRKKNLSSWQNILNSRQNTADTEEKLANQVEFLRGGITRIYLSISSKWKPYHRAINSRPRNLRTTLEKYFRFQRVEARGSTANCEIYFWIFFETIHTILKIFSQHDLRKCR